MSRNLTPNKQSLVGGDIARLEGVEVLRMGSNVTTGKVSFALGPRALLVLVGPPGSGKSAILDLLCFQALPAKGRAIVLGVDLTHLSTSDRPRMRRRVGMVFQHQRLLHDLNVFGNIALAARVAERKPRDYVDRVSELLMWVGLGGRGTDAISKLTEGERRRLSLARALVNQPDLLVADEPTAGLGMKAEQRVLRHFAEVNAAGTPVVLATQERSLAMDLGGVIYDIPPHGPS